MNFLNEACCDSDITCFAEHKTKKKSRSIDPIIGNFYRRVFIHYNKITN